MIDFDLRESLVIDGMVQVQVILFALFSLKEDKKVLASLGQL